MSGAVPRRIHEFFGGLALPGEKDVSTAQPICIAPVPPLLVLPLRRHAGPPARPCVRVGDAVLRNQVIAEADGPRSLPVHASSSGRVIAVEPRPVAHPGGALNMCIVIETDGRDSPSSPALLPRGEKGAPQQADAQAFFPSPLAGVGAPQGWMRGQLPQILRSAGIAGLGGAAFPSAAKLEGAAPIHTLIVNAAECEPWISCDRMLMQERGAEVLRAAELLRTAVGAATCIVALEDDATCALQALQAEARAAAVDIAVLPTRYPQGSERQLFQSLMGRELPAGQRPTQHGVLVYNVATVIAAARAWTDRQPLISRIVTVTGPGVRAPRNIEARLGTPLSFLIELAGGYGDGAQQLQVGGPLNGYAVTRDDLPLTPAVNCVLVRPAHARPPAMPCIRCGECMPVCPSRLLPQQLFWHAHAGELEQAADLNLLDCIECGCCDEVCPSHIPLLQHYRDAKTELAARRQEQAEAAAARQRYQARERRLAAQAQAREAARQRKKVAISEKAAQAQPQDPVAAALARARARRSTAPKPE